MFPKMSMPEDRCTLSTSIREPAPEPVVTPEAPEAPEAPKAPEASEPDRIPWRRRPFAEKKRSLRPFVFLGSIALAGFVGWNLYRGSTRVEESAPIEVSEARLPVRVQRLETTTARGWVFDEG